MESGPGLIVHGQEPWRPKFCAMPHPDREIRARCTHGLEMGWSKFRKIS